jgi:hypothetical protein
MYVCMHVCVYLIRDLFNDPHIVECLVIGWVMNNELKFFLWKWSRHELWCCPRRCLDEPAKSTRNLSGQPVCGQRFVPSIAGLRSVDHSVVTIFLCLNYYYYYYNHNRHHWLSLYTAQQLCMLLLTIRNECCHVICSVITSKQSFVSGRKEMFQLKFS